MSNKSSKSEVGITLQTAPILWKVDAGSDISALHVDTKHLLLATNDAKGDNFLSYFNDQYIKNLISWHEHTTPHVKLELETINRIQSICFSYYTRLVW